MPCQNKIISKLILSYQIIILIALTENDNHKSISDNDLNNNDNNKDHNNNNNNDNNNSNHNNSSNNNKDNKLEL